MNEALTDPFRPGDESIGFRPKTETPRLGHKWKYVVKVGGSLFDAVELSGQLRVLCKRIGEPVLLIAGGGGFAEEVRRLDRIHHWPVELSHQLAIQSMSLGASILAAELQLPIIRTDAELEPLQTPGTSAVVDSVQLQALKELPSGWEVTSDSIASHLATRFAGGRLLLAKSTDLKSPNGSLSQLSTSDLVDQAFPQFAAGLHQLQWVNLRSQPVTIQSIPLPSADAGAHRSLPGE